jgi:hypothetical protein
MHWEKRSRKWLFPQKDGSQWQDAPLIFLPLHACLHVAILRLLCYTRNVLSYQLVKQSGCRLIDMLNTIFGTSRHRTAGWYSLLTLLVNKAIADSKISMLLVLF